MLQLTNIQKSFSGNFEPTLKGINLELLAGEFCVLIGSNGSGKSTLLRSIAGEYQTDTGHIKIAGQDVTAMSLSRRASFIGSVTQDINKGTIPEMTLLENMVLSCMRCRKSSLRFYAVHEEEVLRIVQGLGMGLEQYLYSPLNVLSGGQRQMIATLMAIASKPTILLLDEHTSALDPKTQSILMEYTANSVAQKNITTLMITHKLDDAIRYGDRIIMMDRGCIVLDTKDKQSLQVNELLALFHHYEDMMLQSEGAV